MSEQQLVTLETNSRFSKSLLWQYQREYFHKVGVNAWARGEVPFYVTSNMLIAHNYANIVWRYLQDCLRLGQINLEHPVYIFELGTGSGKFSYMFISTILDLVKHFKPDLKIQYVMTDFTDSNLMFWNLHPQFQPFIQDGTLDFAIYRLDETSDLKLVKKGITLGDNSCVNPLIAIGNYIFDTVNHDAFKITTGKLEEGLLTTKTTPENMRDKEVIALEHLQTEFTFKEITLPYYENDYLNKILEYYQHNIPESTILIPTGGITCIDNLRRLCNNRMLIISGDKGYSSVDNIKNLGTPHIAFHGSFSMMVNFDCMGRYCELLGGDAILAEDHEGMKTSLLLLGQKFKELPETSWANEEFNRHLSTKEFLEIKNKYLEDLSKLELEHILSLLKFSYWDPDIFMGVVQRLSEIINRASNGYLRTLRAGMAHIYRNYYFLKNVKNVPFELGRIYHIIGDLDDAIARYQQSLDLFGEDSSTCFNLGLCFYYKNQLPKALHFFQKAFTINPANKPAQEWITHVEKELAKNP